MRKIILLGVVALMLLLFTACSIIRPELDSIKVDKMKLSIEETKNSKVGTVDYPAEPIHMVIPYKAGGTTDIYGRKLATLLEKYLGQPVVIDNVSGDSGTVGTQQVKNSPSDGYTIMVSTEALGTYQVMGLSELGYHDFTAIAPLVGDPKFILVSKNSKYNTLEDLLNEINENPDEVAMSYSGVGASSHNQGLALKELGYEIVMTNFDSGSEALMGVIDNQMAFTIPNLSISLKYMISGEVKALAVLAEERMEAFPEIPTFTEIVPEAYQYLTIPYTALSLMVNSDTPSDVVDVLKSAITKVFEDPEWTKFIEDNMADKLYDKYKDVNSINQFYKESQSVICWLQYDNGIAPNNPAMFGINRINDNYDSE